jgi:hypothetical protein
MKKISIAVAFLLSLSACWMGASRGPHSPVTQHQGAPVVDGACLAPVPLSAPIPDQTPWNGALPVAPSSDVAWVITPTNPEQTLWELSLVEVKQVYMVARIGFESKDYAAVLGSLAKVASQSAQDPKFQSTQWLAVLGGIRGGGPVPGPIGDPKDVVAFARQFWESGKQVSQGLVNKQPSP